MRVCLITDRPRHPVLSTVMAELGTRHQVDVIDPTCLERMAARVAVELRRPAHVYLLRTHIPAAISLVRPLEAAGAVMVNGSAATAACADRLNLATRCSAAGLPWPRGHGHGWLGSAGAEDGDPREVTCPLEVTRPLVVKSRWSRRSDLVAAVESAGQLAELARAWPGEEVILQEQVESDGVDRKLYVVDGKVECLLRPSPLMPGADDRRQPVPVRPEWRELALEVGEIFDLQVYGVDLMVGAGGPAIVDVNPFPGFRGVPGARGAIVDLVERSGAFGLGGAVFA